MLINLSLAPAHQGISFTAVRITAGFVVLAVLAGVVAWSVWRDKLPRARVWLMFTLGVALAGLLGSVAQSVATGGVWSAGIALFFAVAAVFDLVHHASPAGLGTGGGFGRGGGGARPSRIFHSAMALITPTALLAAIGVIALALGYGSGVIDQIASMITSAI